MKQKQLLGLGLALLLSIAGLTACQSDVAEIPEEIPEETADLDYHPADSPPLRLAVTRPTQMNPLLNDNDTLFQVYHLIYESMITFDDHMKPEPLLAESWELDDQGMSITFNLRSNVTWHDGEPFSPEDVVFTFQVLREQAASLAYPNLYVNNLQQVSDVRKTGDHTVRFTFTRPYSNMLETLAFPVLPQHLFAGQNRNRLTSSQFPLVGTGRYKVESFEASRSMKLHYYPSYWGRKPYIEEIDVIVVPDHQAQLSLFESGEIDLVEPLTVDWIKYTDHEAVSGISYPSTQYEFIGFNFRQEIWQNQNLRQAVAHAIDRDMIMKNIYFGHGHLTDVPVLPTSWLYHGEELRYTHDVTEARRLVESVELPESAIFTLLTNDGNPQREKMANAVAEALAEVGITIEVETVSWQVLQERLAAGQFDLVLTGWHFSMVPDLSFAFHSTQESAGNFIGYENATIDQLLESVFAAPNETQKLERWHQLQQYLLQEVPYVSLLFKEHAVLHRTSLKGELTPNQFNIFRGIESAYLIPQREDTTDDTTSAESSESGS
ncbi:peptide ABC transporter substrate-binding protein [Anoxynatronum sibiricum]|uniref:Peptide ABC transporter substrate-binding protein n=1 Tax=Anoxynatronum sibiricum TaxID=210623 RepID=A0ABU9VRP8_9CLOT